MATFTVNKSTDNGLGNTAGTLSYAIVQANKIYGDDTIVLTRNIRLTGPTVIPSFIDSNISLEGNGFSLSGDVNNNKVTDSGDTRPLFIKSGVVSISNLKITNGCAQGENGGGGGAGMGGGLFIYDGSVTLNNVTFSNNKAIGGNGGVSGRGGGMGIPGIPANNGADGLDAEDDYDNGKPGQDGGLGGNGGRGGVGGYGTGGRGGNGGWGGHGGNGGIAHYGGNGGDGGFGGGGGQRGNSWGGWDDIYSDDGDGGFGGGGGGAGGWNEFGGYGDGCGYGGYGGGGGGGHFGEYDGHYRYSGGQGGFGGGDSVSYNAETGELNYGAGGGGAGMGGGLFIRSGSLSLNNVTFTNNSAVGGTGFENGKGLGGGLFIMQSLTNPNGNNQGMPAVLPVVTTTGTLNFSGNSAADDSGTVTDNDDIWGVISISPVNDNFANRTILTGNNFAVTVTGTNVGATGETGEPNHASVSTPLSSVWYSWTATSNGRVTISTAGSSFDTTLGVYQGTTIAGLTVVASNDDLDWPDISTSQVNFNAVSGATYQIAVDGYTGATGNINLALNFGNDNFANRTILTGNNVTVTGTNVGATGETGEPNHASVSTPLSSVWYSWTATSNGSVTISTAGSSFDTTLGVYQGTTIAGLTVVASNDDFGGSTTSQVNFNAVSGATYQIAVDGYTGATGNINLALNPFIGTPNADNLVGTTGADTLIGLGGNDTYTVNNNGDVVVENLNEGTDTVKSSVTYILPDNVEKLTLTGSAAINGTGNALNNTLIGNSAANIFNGGTGSDTLTGKGGADIFIFRFGESQASTAGRDRITDFAIGTDKIDLLTQSGSATGAPVAFTRAADTTVTNLNPIVTGVFADANGALAGAQPLGVNSAALVKSVTETYLIINDANPGFQLASDLLINIRGYTGSLPNFGAIPVSNFFV